MRNLESFEESCEYRNQPERIFKTFAADIYESPNLDPQTVICYPTHIDGDVVDVEIKMPILVNPSGIRDDVEAALWSEYRLNLGTLHFNLAPKEYSI